MSFQNFRLGDISLHPTLLPRQPPFTDACPAPFSPSQSASATKQPYGSGDTDDGYTLIFPHLDAFNDWRNSEEERNMVEFVKGDTHGSKAIPPRFKDHTKLVCARHSRSGRKKYVKKHPERVRKVPSRKLEGQGCLASISYKTYFDTDEVRACYNSHHSHEIGPANLPYTRRGRKAAVQYEKGRVSKSGALSSAVDSAEASAPVQMNETSSTDSPRPSPTTVDPCTYSSAVSMLAPLPNQPTYAQPAQPFSYPTGGPGRPTYPVTQERWENMATLFQSIREHSRAFEYPTASVAALETVLIRLYLESPVGVGMQPSMGNIMQIAIAQSAGAAKAGTGGGVVDRSNGAPNLEGSS